MRMQRSKKGQFAKGHNPWNKGLKGLQIGGKETQFQKGQLPHNYKTVGSERVDKKDGYILIKVQDHGPYQKRWRHKHVIEWEKENGPVPNGYVLVFADQDKTNIEMDNLLLITRSELALMNKQNLFSTDAEITKASIAMLRLNQKIHNHEIHRRDPIKFKKYLEIAKKTGLSEQTFTARLKRGWSLQDALYKPLGFRRTFK